MKNVKINLFVHNNVQLKLKNLTNGKWYKFLIFKLSDEQYSIRFVASGYDFIGEEIVEKESQLLLGFISFYKNNNNPFFIKNTCVNTNEQDIFVWFMKKYVAKLNCFVVPDALDVGCIIIEEKQERG